MVFTIIGTVIGAGFASGKEIYLFFYRYGAYGIFGIIICCTLITYITRKTLKIILYKDIKQYSDFLNCIFLNNKFLSNFINNIVNIFLCISFFIMVSGFATYLNENLRHKLFCADVYVLYLYVILFF